jgi:hypothetical protein
MLRLIGHNRGDNNMRKGISIIAGIIFGILAIVVASLIIFYSIKTVPKITESSTSLKTVPKIGQPPSGYVITSESNDGIWRRVIREYVKDNLIKIEVLDGPEAPSIQYIKNWKDRPSKAIYYFCGKRFDAKVMDFVWYCVNESTTRIYPLLTDPPLHVFDSASYVSKESKSIINRTADCYEAFQGETNTTLCFDKETNVLLEWRTKTKFGETYTTATFLNLTSPSENEFIPLLQPIDCISKSDCPL